MKEELLKYVQEEFISDSNHLSSCMFPGEECTCNRGVIDYDTDLWKEGYIDSFSVESIVVYIEGVLNIEVPPNEVVPKNFQTVNAMIALIKKLQE